MWRMDICALIEFPLNEVGTYQFFIEQIDEGKEVRNLVCIKIKLFIETI
jgi:hypothetical protein